MILPNNPIDQYQIRLPLFEGPLELLLYQIKSKNLAVEEISISLITADFIRFVDEYKKIKHHAIADFIAMASLLLFIKSNEALPIHKEIELDEEIEDPRTSIVYQLIEYEKLKRMSGFLQERTGELVLLKKESEDLNTIKNRVSYQEFSFKELLGCYLSFFSPKAKKLFERVKETISTLEEKIKWISKVLKNKVKVSFFNLTEKLERAESVVTFQATLEMAKQSQISLYQDELFGDITIENNKRTADGEQEEIA
ncbi:MAG TPA: hypothetical protein DHW82_07580 [Spirochaetia bacterium]|nr:MAG: hypothetical protein A2Y41_13040 [Spirochaetes bacterium GWB1_36_13]HCL56854.1 hypothetical protein [Spirochaetia bacterium]